MWQTLMILADCGLNAVLWFLTVALCDVQQLKNVSLATAPSAFV